MGRPWLIVFCFSVLLTPAVNGQQERYDNPRANLSTLWVNNDANLSNIEYSRAFSSGELFRPILRTSPSGFGERYACGFYKNGSFSGYLFAVLMVYVNSGGTITMATVSPQPVWAANRNRLVGENATLEFTAAGNLVLRDENRIEVWSTGTIVKGVVSMEMFETGNLVLRDGRGQNVWESFNSPTDVLVLGQALRSGMKLTSSISAANPAEGSYVLEMKGNTLSLSAKGSPPQKYWSASAKKSVLGDITPYAMFTNGSILFFVTSSSAAAYSRSGSANDSDGSFLLQSSSDAQYLQLPPNGNLGVFTKDYSSPETRLSYNIFKNDDCSTWPGSCGQYSICNLGQCSCVSADVAQDTQGTFLQAVQYTPSMGCKPAVPLSGCSSNGSSQAAQHGQRFLSMKGVHYIPMEKSGSNLTVSSSGACQQICSNNCSCKMAIYFRSTCYTFDEVYTLRSASYIFPDGNLTGAPMAMIKVQNAPDKRTTSTPPIRTILLAVLLPLLACVAVGNVCIWLRKRMQQQRRRKEELALDAMIGLPRRFSYKELQQATWNFSRKLGQGGFGTVFLADLPNINEKVAVKRLDNASHGHKDFRTEVSVIGRVRHMNLVQLKGFCAENEYRMLVYELVVNSSLDKWLFPQKEADHEGNNINDSRFLNWDARLNIALGVARGLAYLHEGCSEKIIHLDVKAQNILLDADLNAKVCDFGLSRLVKQDESSVVTTMRGTPGYMAPEWLQSSITEKVDVYSYGVVLLELLSGQKCLDMTRLQDGSSRLHFPSWANQRKTQGGSLTDLLDERLGPELENQVEKMATLFDLALLCAQEEPAKRPTMGRVVQVLEDMMVGQSAITITENDKGQSAKIITENDEESLVCADAFVCESLRSDHDHD